MVFLILEIVSLEPQPAIEPIGGVVDRIYHSTTIKLDRIPCFPLKGSKGYTRMSGRSVIIQDKVVLFSLPGMATSRVGTLNLSKRKGSCHQGSDHIIQRV
jgi:hypothetical protein